MELKSPVSSSITYPWIFSVVRHCKSISHEASQPIKISKTNSTHPRRFICMDRPHYSSMATVSPTHALPQWDNQVTSATDCDRLLLLYANGWLRWLGVGRARRGILCYESHSLLSWSLCSLFGYYSYVLRANWEAYCRTGWLVFDWEYVVY